MAAAVLGDLPIVLASPKMLGSPVAMAAHSPIASPGLSPRYHTSTSLHDPFNPGPSTATIVSEAALSPMTFIDLSECPQLFSMIPSCFKTRIICEKLTHY